MAEHIVPKRVYYTIFAVLILCTALTVAIAFVDLGALNAVAALTIAVFTRLTWAVVVGSVFWLGILLVLTMSDYLTRGWRTYG